VQRHYKPLQPLIAIVFLTGYRPRRSSQEKKRTQHIIKCQWLFNQKERKNANQTQSLPQRTWALPNALSLTRLQRFRVIVVVVVVCSSAGEAAADIITFSSRTWTACVLVLALALALAPPARLALELATLPKSIIAMGAAAVSFSLSAPLIAESLLLSSSPTLLPLLLLLAPAHR